MKKLKNKPINKFSKKEFDRFIKRLKQINHSVWREKVLERNGDKCSICKRDLTDKRLRHIHHIIGKEFKELRYDENNGILLCPKCHKFGKFSAHKNGLWFSEWLRKNRPEQYKYLILKLKGLENG